jgi:L-methionine (R)-S-oxide reductase
MSTNNKTELLTNLLPVVKDSIDKAADFNAACVAAVELLHQGASHFKWTGIYLLEDGELKLHNYIGKETQHLRIPIGRGVCGSAVAQKRDILVKDVSQLDNYLACSLDTRSEIVVLIRIDDYIIGQIDIDSDQVSAFDDTDHELLEKVAARLAQKHIEGE